jgi:hypothetical protein
MKMDENMIGNAKRPNLLEQLLWSVIRPKKLFEAVREKPMITLPILLIVISGIGAGIAGYKAVGAIDYSQLGNIPPQQAEAMKDMMSSPALAMLGGVSAAFGQIFGNLAGLFIKALIMWGIIRMLGGKGDYLRSVSVVGLSWIPLFIRNCIQAVVGANVDINRELAAMDLANFNFMNLLSSSFMNEGIVFIIWNIILLGIGYSIVFGVSRVKTIITAFLYWLVSFLLAVGWGWGALQFSQKMQGMVPKQ